jgi:hypothetical protein
MQHVDLMDEFRETKLQDLRRQIECGEYVVDPTAVAASLVRRVWGFDVTPEPPEVLAIVAPAHRDHARSRPLAAVSG